MPGCIIVYVGEGDHYWPLIARATAIAKQRESRLIFYDSDAASRLGASPLPTWWSSDGLPEQFENRLGPDELERAGRQELRDHVANARSEGIDAHAWLPSKRGARELAEYATEQRADLLIIPSDLEQKGLADWLKGQPTADEVADETKLPLLVVDLKQEVNAQ